MLSVILLFVCTLLLYHAVFKPYNYWKSRGTLYEKPWPFFGNLAPAIFQKQSVAELIQNVYNKHPDQRYVGIYQFFVPTLVLRDPALIQQIALKHFDFFHGHEKDTLEEENSSSTKSDGELPNKNPAFTKHKLKDMFGFITECAMHFTDHFINKGDFIRVDMEEAFSKVIKDMISRKVLDVAKDLKDPDDQIILNGASNTNGMKNFKFLATSILLKFFKVQFTDDSMTTFFKQMVQETIKVPEEKKIIEVDMAYLMMEARNGRLRRQSTDVLFNQGKNGRMETREDFIANQAVLLFLGEFDVISKSMCFTAYELAQHPGIQEKLRKEVDWALEDSNGRGTYENLLEMKYLDMVISEALRKWPPFPIIERRLTKSFSIEPKLLQEKLLSLNGEIVCQIPIYAIHRDSKYYPNPENFDPERFNDENKEKLKPFTYLPFGGRSRSCIESHFALLEIKTVMFHLLTDFEIVPINKTRIPLVMSKSDVNAVPVGGFWLGLKPRRAISL